MPRDMVSTTPLPADGQTVGGDTVASNNVGGDYAASSAGPRSAAPSRVIHGDNLAVIATLPDESFRLIYLDPPFNTGRTQQRQNIRTVRNADGARKGFQGQSYETVKGTLTQYDDRFADYWGFLEPRLIEAWRLLDDRGTLYLHLDYREAHYAKVALDALFGRDNFLNEIIWAYDYGARATKKWPSKHDTILVYVKNPRTYYFDNLSVDREPYMAPGLVTPEKVALGKLPTDVWWHTIVSPNGREKTGYATQKPEGIVRRIIQASSAPGDWVLDFFAGSGTTGAVAQALDRRFVLVDENPDAIAIMRARLGEGAVFSRHAEAARSEAARSEAARAEAARPDAAPPGAAPSAGASPAQTPSPGTMTP